MRIFATSELSSLAMRIGLAIDRRGSPSEMLLSGIATYARPSSEWVLKWEQPTAAGVERLLQLGVDGILAKHLDAQGLALIERSEIPAVHMTSALNSPRIASVDNDDRAIGQMAADHFVNRGYQHFGYYAQPRDSIDPRIEGFDATLRERGRSCLVAEADPGHPAHTRSSEPSARKASEALRAWLSGLPKPIAIFCRSDNAALSVAEHCRELSIVVPDEVAILGVDNDVAVCSLADPPLSSVQIAGERMGYVAAELLNELMTQNKNARAIFVQPIRVVDRRSTDAIGAKDLMVARALMLLLDHHSDPDCMHQIITSLPCSRRTFERKFRESTGLSPVQAWLRFRLEEARCLLVKTELAVEEVAERSGFGDILQLQVAFRKAFRQTPTQFRRYAVPAFQVRR